MQMRIFVGRKGTKMMKTVLTMLVCAVVAVGYGRKATPLSAGVPVCTNTVLPSPTEVEVKEPSQPPQMTTQTEVVVGLGKWGLGWYCRPRHSQRRCKCPPSRVWDAGLRPWPPGTPPVRARIA